MLGYHQLTPTTTVLDSRRDGQTVTIHYAESLLLLTIGRQQQVQQQLISFTDDAVCRANSASRGTTLSLSHVVFLQRLLLHNGSTPLGHNWPMTRTVTTVFKQRLAQKPDDCVALWVKNGIIILLPVIRQNAGRVSIFFTVRLKMWNEVNTTQQSIFHWPGDLRSANSATFCYSTECINCLQIYRSRHKLSINNQNMFCINSKV